MERFAADTGQMTALTGRLGKQLQVYALSPLQLACRLGDHSTFKHVLRKQAKVVWRWGPLTQYSISLAGIDSAGTGGCGAYAGGPLPTLLWLCRLLLSFWRSLYSVVLP